MPDAPDDLIPTSKAKRILKCHPSTLHRWRDSGRLGCWRIGGRYYYSEAEVRAMLQPITPPVLPDSKQERESRIQAAAAALRSMGLKI